MPGDREAYMGDVRRQVAQSELLDFLVLLSKQKILSQGRVEKQLNNGRLFKDQLILQTVTDMFPILRILTYHFCSAELHAQITQRCQT